MKTDGSVIIDTRIIDGGMEKGFEAIKKEMSSVGLVAEELGKKIKISLSGDASMAITQAFAKVQDLEQKLSAATSEFNAAVADNDDKAAERLAAKRESIYDKLEDARRKLATAVVKESEKEEAAEKKAAQKALKEKERAYKKATKSAKSFSKRLTSIISGALVFNVISKGLREITDYFEKALSTNEKFTDSWQELKAALLTAFQPLYEVMLPELIEAVRVATKLALVLGRLFSSMSGKNTQQMKDNAKALYEEANAIEEVGKSAKKSQKGLAGFDEINTIGNRPDSESSPNFNLDAIDTDAALGEMVAHTSAAILALGLILLLSGTNIPLGIGMIALGTAGMYQSIKENWGGVEGDVISTADAIAAIGGAVLLAIGIIITFCCPTHLALGIGLIIGGAALLGETVALNWNAIEEALKDPIAAVVLLIAGAILVALGILCCFVQSWGLGIALIVAGAAAIVTPIVVNWNAIVEAMRGPIGAITAIVSGALLVLGIILVCTGVGIPLGIGLIIAGAAGLATAVAFNWNAIVDWVKEAWDKVKEFWNKNIAPVFTKKFWEDLAKKCGNGLIAGFEGAVNGIISIFEKMINWISEGLNKISIDIPDWVPVYGGKKFGLNIPQVKFSSVSIPRLAKGAVIPPNQEFMAVLGDQRHGTNIEAPLDTIKQALAEVLALQEGTGETVVNVTFNGDLAQLARILKPAIDTETRRKGGSLATGGTY